MNHDNLLHVRHKLLDVTLTFINNNNNNARKVNYPHIIDVM